MPNLKLKSWTDFIIFLSENEASALISKSPTDKPELDDVKKQYPGDQNWPAECFQ